MNKKIVVQGHKLSKEQILKNFETFISLSCFLALFWLCSVQHVLTSSPYIAYR